MTCLRTTILFLCLSLAACLSGSPEPDQSQEQRIGFSQIVKGIGTENQVGTAKMFAVIKDENIFRDVFKNLIGKPAPAIDFQKEMVLFVQMGTRASSGYSIEVAELIDHQSYIEARVISKSPGRSCINTLALTRPYQFIKFSRTDREIVFSETLIVTECE